MNALDTNVVARYILRDDPRQAEIATAILAGPCFLSDTVLIELCWLLSSRYRVGRADLVATLRDLLLLPRLMVSDDALIGWAIDRFAAGADFADMMHILSGRHADRFVSFEKRMAVLAGPDTPIPIETPA